METKTLNEDNLEKVAGGSSQEKAITILVDIPLYIEDVEMEVYYDGELDLSKSRTFDSSVRTTNLTFRGENGTHEVKIKFNKLDVSIYALNFDDGSYICIG